MKTMPEKKSQGEEKSQEGKSTREGGQRDEEQSRGTEPTTEVETPQWERSRGGETMKSALGNQQQTRRSCKGRRRPVEQRTPQRRPREQCQSRCKGRGVRLPSCTSHGTLAGLESRLGSSARWIGLWLEMAAVRQPRPLILCKNRSCVVLLSTKVQF